MRDYVSDEWRGILRHNHIADFQALWNREVEWFEPPNQRRGGWSGVARCELATPEDGPVAVFLKRQENHTTRTLLHPFGMPTFVREMRNILRFKRREIPALEPVYFAHRRINGNLRAILITEALDNYISLEELVRQWRQSGWPAREKRTKIMAAVVDVMRLMNKRHLQHNCFYPKHIFLRFEDGGDIEVRIIDLEKAKWRLLTYDASFRDLYTLNRHSQAWSRTDRLRFFLMYMQLDRLTPRAKLFWRRIAHRTISKGRVRQYRQADNS